MANAIKPIIKLTEACNYSCTFCRYANHKQGGTKMDIEMVKKILFQSAEYNRGKSNNVKVIFHGGEPLLWGINNFREIIQYEKKITEETGVFFKNSVQTNASLIDDDWINLFVANHISVGISIDGPIELNEHHSNNIAESCRKTLTAIQRIKAYGGSCGVLSVITNNHINMGAKVFYDFLVDNNIYNCGLCYCYNPEDDCSVDATKLGTYLINLFDLYFAGHTRMNIREFNGAIYKILKGKTNCCNHNCRTVCGDYLTFVPSGDTFFCDAYDIKKENSLGNIIENNVVQMLSSEKYRNLVQIIQNRAKSFCCDCNVKSICGYGCPRTDNVNGNENYFCTTNKMLYSHIASKVAENT